ncbi:hypothetical protein [Brachybacterium hainanense]|uniref:Uncharacterized protein n=1 Tax=Brachybacterium hainanense TaxID=1541174 RepID=A0ABV6RFH6_9MICO
MGTQGSSPVQRLQIIGVSVVGAIAVIAFVLSLLIDGGTGDALRTVAGIAAAICAVIGVSFALTGGRS